MEEVDVQYTIRDIAGSVGKTLALHNLTKAEFIHDFLRIESIKQRPHPPNSQDICPCHLVLFPTLKKCHLVDVITR